MSLATPQEYSEVLNEDSSNYSIGLKYSNWLAVFGVRIEVG